MADPEPEAAAVLVDEKEQKDVGASSSVDASPAGVGAGSGTEVTPTSAATTAGDTTQRVSPPASPPLRSQSQTRRQPTPAVNDYYSARPKHDKLGNPIPDRHRPSAMSAALGNQRISLPGDLGKNDPRRPRSPAPQSLPGDLGPNDPRKPRSAANSPAPSSHSRHASDPLEAPEGNRILKDPKPAPESEPPTSDREEEADASGSNDDTDTSARRRRGRPKIRPEPGRTTAGKAINVRSDSADSDAPPLRKPDPTKGESAISFHLTPPTKSAGSSHKVPKKRIHPSTAFDSAPSALSTPHTSDDESHSELLAAQKLSLALSAVHSTPSAHRVIRQIIRGDYAHFQREAEDGRKRQRMYLVATDISPEAEYALEWTIGTVLRDGDTLFAVYAVDEDSAEKGGEGGVEIGHGADSVRDTAAIVRGLPTFAAPPPASTSSGAKPSPLAQTTAAAETPRSRSRNPHAGAGASTADSERRRALEDITTRITTLLRRTRLQIRVVVEVFHCKSPRHMITEVIDFLSPTLVIIGSRGRSAVKGVLLGSFSNYLVTKSSVPVMVARKKLRKHGKRVRNRDGTVVPYSGSTGRGRLSNVIEAPRGRGLRVKGWDEVGID